MAPWAVVLIVIIVVLLLIATARRRSPSDGESTAGHYDPNAIGRYTLDPATMGYRYELPDPPARTDVESPHPADNNEENEERA